MLPSVSGKPKGPQEKLQHMRSLSISQPMCIMLETLQLDKSKQTKYSLSTGDIKLTYTNKKSVAAVTSEVKPEKCLTCKERKHRAYYCPTFLNLAPQDRIKKIKRLKVCLNCFKVGHSIEACKFGTCRICHKKHNTLLHIPRGEDTDSESNNQRATTVEQKPPTEQTTSVTHPAVPIADRRLLATAIIKIQDNDGEFQECRAFLDPGSQSNFMTRDLCEQLSLPQRRNYLAIRGVDDTQTAAFTDTRATIQSKFNGFKVKLKFSVLPKITTNLPLSEIDKRHLQIPDSITLADPLFYKPGSIDVLLGSSIFWDLLCVGQIKLGRNQPVAQKTKLERFWQVEEGSLHANLSETEQICEDEFVKRHRRNAEGRFEVRLPLRDKVEHLGQSQKIAIKRLKGLEQKFVSSPELKVQYTNFMREYQELGHMSEVINQGTNGTINYLPHHGVWKDDSLITKLRVVFDASCPTTSGVSLNDILHVGPTIQENLFSIIHRFCQHQFVITADIKQMYRQILLQDNQRDLQRIVWRPNTNEQIKEYRLNTVTYGLASAPFLAIRCLHQLANENQKNYPRTSDVIRNDFYVDDLISGGNDPDSLIRLKTELTKIFQSAGFALHKWNFNKPTIFSGSSETKTLLSHETKTLGICWNTKDDCLQYRINITNRNQRATKRSVLSIIAQMYDPLGLMGPTLISAKIIMQQLWQLKVGWDESLFVQLHTKWMQFLSQLEKIESISIPRRIICNEPHIIELHGFCDASEAVYSASTYGAPTSQEKQLQDCCVQNQGLHLSKYWSNSTITLSWIKRSPGELQTFVVNRVATIQRIAPGAQWSHVRSKDNPADIISRGSTLQNLKDMPLWWTGPPWLARGRDDWPTESISNINEIPELRKQTVIMGDLPKSRVTVSRAFINSGVDYAGPFPIKLSRNRTVKAYLCIFICFATKATYLEIVSDLTTTAFLNELKRFIARRGRCMQLFSDNGTNFIGANNELRALANMIDQERETIE
ncbi:uncharacterized protein LOC105198615 [Solenopsis invicta]|uniref:uncharacterized protein LOC105198615 n=1 Tax=Solenopsis invicta TaxID=13686 RepID=UPI000595CAD6|nr:uncharacterized protein LOC105198615 [Solenopsis invicta]